MGDGRSQTQIDRVRRAGQAVVALAIFTYQRMLKLL
jgi:hypothetical protein